MASHTETLRRPIPTPARPAPVAAPADPAREARRLEEAAIRLRAYQKWQAAGRPKGDGVNFWLEAERELMQSR